MKLNCRVHKAVTISRIALQQPVGFVTACVISLDCVGLLSGWSDR